MPESKKRKKVVERQGAQQRAREHYKEVAPQRSPKWWVPVMVGFAVVGLIIVVLAYIFNGNVPIPGFGNGNLFIGVGLMMVGFLMTMGWR
ncbi:MAG: cell division protein CrgA [Trueperella sp.]|nr:cell division protein CrgA [Trueperella sp.]